MTKVSPEVTTTTVIGNFSINLPAPNNAQISASGYLVEGEDRASLDARMDMVREALQRQQRMLEIPVLEAHIEQWEHARDDLQRAHADLLQRNLDAHNGKGKTLPSQDQANLKSHPQQIKHIEAEIEKARAKLADARAGK